MYRKILFSCALLFGSLQVTAQHVKLNGVFEGFRNNDGDDTTSKYVGWNSQLQKSIFVVDQGIYTMTWDGTSLTAPTKDPAVNIADFYSAGAFTDNDKAMWASDFNLMAGNSGAVHVDGVVYTVFSRDEQSTTEDEMFAVRCWDAETGKLYSERSKYYPASACLESAGMSYNPVDGKVYGLFLLTGQALSEEITSDPDFFTDTDGDATDTDAGYCVCTIDLATMKLTPITPGLYYQNFVTFAINSEGRAFAMTSGGTSGVKEEDGRITNINGDLAGAQLCEFDLATGLMKTRVATLVDTSTGETYEEAVNIYPHGTGYCSQYRRQAACFAKSNPNKMYWNGFVNSGKGISDTGSWTSLPDREWRTNEKFDTALYEVDITTGEAVRLAKIQNRYRFSCLWVDGDDISEGALNGTTTPLATHRAPQIYNLKGQRMPSSLDRLPAGVYVVDGKRVVK